MRQELFDPQPFLSALALIRIPFQPDLFGTGFFIAGDGGGRAVLGTVAHNLTKHGEPDGELLPWVWVCCYDKAEDDWTDCHKVNVDANLIAPRLDAALLLLDFEAPQVMRLAPDWAPGDEVVVLGFQPDPNKGSKCSVACMYCEIPHSWPAVPYDLRGILGEPMLRLGMIGPQRSEQPLGCGISGGPVLNRRIVNQPAVAIEKAVDWPHRDEHRVPEVRATALEWLRDLFARLPRQPVQLPARETTAHASPVRSPQRFIDSDIGLPDNWVDKTWDGDRLEELLKQKENPPRVVEIQDIGGAGKSSFARWFLDELQGRGPKFDVEVWFSFYRMRDVSEPFGRFLDYVLDKLDPATDRPPGTPTSQKRERLEQICRERSILFFLDGLEVAQTANASERWMKEEEAEKFLVDACNFPKGCMVITTREPLQALDGNQGFHKFKLSDWTPEAIYRYMTRAGIQGTRAEIQRVVDVLGVHSLLLAVFAGMLRDYYGGRIENASAVIDAIGHIPGADERQLDLRRQERKLRTIIEEIVTRLDPKALDLMKTLSALSGAASEEMFEMLRGDLTDIGFRAMIRSLEASALIVIGERGDRRTISAHPLVRACFYRRMSDEERKALHRELADYFQRRPRPVDPYVLTDLDDLIEWFRQLVGGGYFSEALEVAREENLGDFLFYRGWFDADLDLLQSLVDAGANEMPPHQVTYVQRIIGHIHRKLGRMPEAFKAFKIARRRAKAAGLRSEVIDATIQIAITRGFQGHFMLCRAILKKDQTPDAEFTLKAPRLEWLGYASAVQGDRQAGLPYLREAERLCRREVGPGANDRYLAPTLIHIADVLLLFDDPIPARNDACKIYKEALILCTEKRKFKDHEGDARRGLGNCYRLEGRFEEARQQYEEALKIAEEIGYRFLATEVLIAMARLAEQQGKSEIVQSRIGEAMELARPRGYLVQQGECLLIRARESLRGGGRVSEEEIREIKRLADRTHHRRLQSELEALLNQLRRER